MRLDIRLLGPLEVAVDGRPVRLASRLRAVLAVLAMSPGRTVPVDRIAEALWDHAEPPSNPRASVQTYIASPRSWAPIRRPGCARSTRRCSPGRSRTRQRQ